MDVKTVLASAVTAAVVSGGLQILIWILTGRRDRRTWSRAAAVEAAADFLDACDSLVSAAMAVQQSSRGVYEDNDDESELSPKFHDAHMKAHRAMIRFCLFFPGARGHALTLMELSRKAIFHEQEQRKELVEAYVVKRLELTY